MGSKQLKYLTESSCMNPDPPPEWTNLKDVYIPNTELPLNYTIQYPCKDYHFFSDDIEQEFFEVKCTNGIWDPNPTWQNCTHPSGKMLLYYFLSTPLIYKLL